MAWRFTASKFKNTTPKLPKKEDTVFDLPIGNLSCTNNGIQSSSNWIAFHIDGEGGKLGYVPVGTKGRKIRSDIGIVCAHAEQVDDFTLLPFSEDTLVTCSRDEAVKVWTLSDGSPALHSQIDVGGGRLVDCLSAHSTASGLVAASGCASVFVLDVDKATVAIEMDGGLVDKTQSMSWSDDGKILAVSADKGRQGVIFDPRSKSAVHELELHGGMGREGRVLFAGDDTLISSGFTNKRVQEVRVYDARKWGTAVQCEEYIATTGVLLPFYDRETKLVFLAGKGTNKLVMAELQNRAPVLSPVFEMPVPEQFLGACLGAKRSIHVMDGEVATFYQLTKHSVVPLPCIVPRRSYRDFHADLFPDCVGPSAGCTGEQWLGGCDDQPALMSMAPSGGASSTPSSNAAPPPAMIVKPAPASAPAPAPAPTPTPSVRSSEPVSHKESERESERESIKELDYVGESVRETTESVRERVAAVDRSNSVSPNQDSQKENAPVVAGPQSTKRPEPSEQAPVVRIRQANTGDANCARPLSQRVRPRSCVVGQMQSKFRHHETLVGVKAGNALFHNLRNVNTRMPPEAATLCCSDQFIAVPLSGPAGVVLICDVDQPAKLPDGVLDGIFNKAQITDMCWNPFDSHELAVGTDSGAINLWRLEKKAEGEDGDGGQKRSELEPQSVIRMGGEKIVCMRWHPLACDLLAVALSDSSIRLVNTRTGECAAQWNVHHQGVLAMAWSADGRKIVSVGKDLMLNVLLPQLGQDCLVAQKKILESPRAARVVFACDDRLIVVVGLTRSSGRQVVLLDATTLSVLHTQSIDSATQPLIPHYDFDSSVLFLTGKGDRIVSMFEVCAEEPYLLPLAGLTQPAGHQAVCFHHKTRCDVMAVEFQRGWRLTEKTLEALVFRVPRVKKDVFQSDLFPDALVTWQGVCSAEEWLAGSQAAPAFRCLKPEGVSALVMAAPAAPRLARRTQVEGHKDKEADEVKKEVEASWSQRIHRDHRLEQDRMEGVAEEEWAE